MVITGTTVQSNTLTGNYNTSTYIGIAGQLLSSSVTIGPNNVTQGFVEGMDLDKQGAPLITGERIESNIGQGIVCYGGASPNIYKVGSNQSNKIKNNGDPQSGVGSPYTNIFADGMSLPFLGNNTGTPGNNQITNPTSAYLIYTENTSILYAQNNWWGSSSGPNELQFFHPIAGDDRYIKYIPYLTSAPSKVIVSLPRIKQISYETESPSRDFFDRGYQLYVSGQYGEAATLFEQAWQADPQSSDAISALSFLDKSLVEEGGETTASLDRLTQIATTYNGAQLGGRASQFKLWRLMQAGRFDEALSDANAIIEDYNDPELQAYAWHDLGIIYTHGLNDQDRGEAAFRTLINNYPAHRLARLAMIELGEWTGTNLPGSQNESLANKTVPQQYALIQSIPNPFNPTTTIRYDLPEAVYVHLTVYNILGQEVVTLVNAPQQPGTYTVVWDGRDASGLSVGSGVYIYRLKAGNFQASQKMTLLK